MPSNASTSHAQQPFQQPQQYATQALPVRNGTAQPQQQQRPAPVVLKPPGQAKQPPPQQPAPIVLPRPGQPQRQPRPQAQQQPQAPVHQQRPPKSIRPPVSKPPVLRPPAQQVIITAADDTCPTCFQTKSSACCMQRCNEFLQQALWQCLGREVSSSRSTPCSLLDTGKKLCLLHVQANQGPRPRQPPPPPPPRPAPPVQHPLPAIGHSQHVPKSRTPCLYFNTPRVCMHLHIPLPHQLLPCATGVLQTECPDQG